MTFDNFYTVKKQSKTCDSLINNEKIMIFNKLSKKLYQCIEDCVQNFYKSIFLEIFDLKESSILNSGKKIFLNFF